MGTALVTGGARGIGLGISKALLRDRHDLIICGRKDPEEVSGIIEDLRKIGPSVCYYTCDVSSSEARQILIELIKSKHGSLNYLINNAGVAPESRDDLLEASEESYDRVMSINLKGPYFLTQQLANYFVEQKSKDDSFSACIVNITSVSAKLASTNRGEYCISKAGLSMASRLWAVRLAEFGFPVYEIQVGLNLTDMTAKVKEKYDDMIEKGLTLEKRWGYPKDVGRATAALIRGDIPYATGQVLTIDGGMMIDRL